MTQAKSVKQSRLELHFESLLPCEVAGQHANLCRYTRMKECDVFVSSGNNSLFVKSLFEILNPDCGAPITMIRESCEHRPQVRASDMVDLELYLTLSLYMRYW